MGVPKLFKYLTERYPSLCQTVSANQLPHYDYLYIDLNFLIHKSLNEKNVLPLEKVDDAFYTETRIFERVMRYIETLHRIVPSNVLFLSIDGVAPRAKWATQRDRRLRSAERSDVPPTQFDTNAISPGTTFMHNFEVVLIEFITNKMKVHKNWQMCQIYVSRSSVPGEGSLKIIQFIRSLKQSNDYKPNETHCIYSGDNDYLLLGIATHELYVSFIQENKKNNSSMGTLCSDDIKHTFSVIHFELLRQYLRMEFVECQSAMMFEFKMDSIVDDWVVLMALIGNDYLPGLPKFSLDSDILSIIYDTYKEVLKTSNGYINDMGLLNMRRFGRLLQLLKTKDFDLYRAEQMNGCVNAKMAAINLKGEATESNGGEHDVKFSDFLEMKDQFYTEHLGHSELPDFKVMSANYVKSIQWVLFYYFRGIYTWNHYYPFSCAPFVSDFTQVHNLAFSFELDKPVKALSHLLAILPKSSSSLLPTSHRKFAVDVVRNMDELLEQAKTTEKCMNPEDGVLNTFKSMLNLKYEKSTKEVKVIDILPDLKIDHALIEKNLDRPLKRNNFNFLFSTLNLHDFSSQLMPAELSKSHPRMVIKLNAPELGDIDSIAETFLKQTVYVNWPHCVEAKVMQIFDAAKKLVRSGDEIKTIEKPRDFSSCVESLNSLYSEAGLDIGEIKMVAFVVPRKWVEYEPVDDKPNVFEPIEHWDEKKWYPVAVQILTKSMANISQINPTSRHIPVKDALLAPHVFLSSEKSYHYGEIATVADTQSLDANGRVNILCYKMLEPDFEQTKSIHITASAGKMSEYKQLSSAASLIGISEKVLAKITGSVIVSSGVAKDILQKINIGLQFKNRNPKSFVVRHAYVKNMGNKFVYSQKAIDLVQQYMNTFPRVFEVLSTSGELEISDFEENNNQNGLDYLGDIRQWLKTLPHFKEVIRSVDLMQLTDEAITDVKAAIDKIYGDEPKILKLKMKWQNLFIPDLNNIFVIPCPDAVYKLLDRIVIVRSGYPFRIGAEGTVIGIEPNHCHYPGNDITDHNLFVLEILMDEPYRIESKLFEFKSHQMFRTSSTNMLLNISHGRVN